MEFISCLLLGVRKMEFTAVDEINLSKSFLGLYGCSDAPALNKLELNSLAREASPYSRSSKLGVAEILKLYLKYDFPLPSKCLEGHLTSLQTYFYIILLILFKIRVQFIHLFLYSMNMV